MSPPGTPITIRGVTYPSLAAAGRALGVHTTCVWQAKKRGTQDFIGLVPLKTSALIAKLAKASSDQFPYLQQEARKWLAHQDRKRQR